MGSRSALPRLRGWSRAGSYPSSGPATLSGVGQRVGLIRFGSRVDVYLPVGTDAKVLLGQTVIAGETILAEVGQQLTD